MAKQSKIEDFMELCGYTQEGGEWKLHSIDDGEYKEWLKTVRGLLGVLRFRSEESFSNFKVPSGQRNKQTRDPYAPRTVSIGPLHCHDKLDHYLIDDVEKWRFMLWFLHRFGGDAKEALNKCADTVKEEEEEARRTYWKTIRLTKLEMMEMLLVDGCFLLELFIRYKQQREDDPLSGGAWMLEDLQHDLALLENQIPLKVLQKLFENLKQQSIDQHTSYSDPKRELTKYILLFFQPALNLSSASIDDKLIPYLSEKPIMNILDLIRHVFLSTLQPKQCISVQIDNTRANTESFRNRGFTQSAKKLHNDGIQFKGVDMDQLVGISFDDNKGVLTIPCMSINRITKSIFKNLIAFEQCCPGRKHQILSSYVILMRSLLDSKHDVELLHQKGILEKKPISSENILTFFKDLCPEVLEMKRFNSTDHKENQEFQFRWVCDQVNRHIKARSCGQIIQAWAKNLWHDSKVTLKEKYFKTTWSMLSVAAAVVLLILTVLQTVYTVISYYHRG